MKRNDLIHALSALGKTELAEFLRKGPLLAFDFDGTLAPIVTNPLAAAMSAETAERLAKLALALPCVVISGRARSDVLARLAGIPIAEVIGNHGSEPWLDLAPLRAEVSGWIPVIQDALAQEEGVLVENKGCSLSIHYRHAVHRRKTLTSLRRLLCHLRIPRVVQGKCVLNLMPAGALHKGEGLLRAMAALSRTHALYIGDDVTDEDVFALPEAEGKHRQARVLGIRVGPRLQTQAPLYLRNQAEINALLEALIEGARCGLPAQSSP